MTLRCDTFQVGRGPHFASVSRKAVSHSVMDSGSSRAFLACQGVVSSSVLEQAAFACPGLFDPDSQPSPGQLFSMHRPASLALARFQPSRVFSFDQSLCAVMISCVFRVRLTEKEKTCPFDARTWSHLRGPVIAFAQSSYFMLCVPFHISSPPCSFPSLGFSCLPVRFLSILSS